MYTFYKIKMAQEKDKFINLTVIIPVFNEEKTLSTILNEIKFLEKICNLEIIIINDGSTDNTKQVIQDNKELYSTAINLEKNKGKGNAVIEGLKNSNGDYIIIQDADLEYDPKDIEKFLIKIKKSKADCIMGSRFTGNERSVLNFWHMIGNKFITLLFNFMNNTAFTDIYCCYCLFEKDLVNPEQLKSNGWGQQAEILTYVIKNSKKIYEIAVNYNGRTYDDGKKIRYYNVFEVIYWMLNAKIKIIFKLNK